jgi:signal transduction histidine kinase
MSLDPSASPVLAISSLKEQKQSKPLSKARQAADLVFTHDALGQYLSFYWQGCKRVGIEAEQLINTQMSPANGPVALDRYLSKVRWVLGHLKPDQFRETFCYAGQQFEFDITLSPILLPHQPVRTLLVLGKSVTSPITLSQDCHSVSNHSLITEMGLSRYHRLFTQIAWNIRRTLDLETIWQQAVNGLGNVLNVERCIICSYEPDQEALPIVAEYQRVPTQSLRGQSFNLVGYPHLRRTLEKLTPVSTIVGPNPEPKGEGNCTLVALATSYQDRPNGLIVMGYGACGVDTFLATTPTVANYSPNHLASHAADCQPHMLWSDEELELVGELADQVGTAIAHAQLVTEAQTLAGDLQKANDTLREKHWELEEASKRAEEASRLKSEFLANTSHELRTPLNGMIGFLKLVLDDLADSRAEEREFITQAYDSSVLLLDIINDILDVAKIEAGRMALELNPVNLNALLLDIENKTRRFAEQKTLTYEIIPPATRDEVIVFGDYQRLLQVMLNLVNNAIKFTLEGGVTIRVQIRRQPMVVQERELPGCVKVSVADTGIGVSLENQLKLFQAFSQVDSSRTRQFGGTGLGLLISQRLVEAMGGTVHFYSMGEGLGSTVTFTVPLFQLPVTTTDMVHASQVPEEILILG